MMEIIGWICVGVGVGIVKREQQERQKADLDRRFARVEGRLDKLEGGRA